MQATRTRPSLRDEQKALTRRRLLEAAESVFARRGFHGASVEEIAREAGATTGALYSNFAGKEDLFLALFEETIVADVRDYSEAFSAAETSEEQLRGPTERWMQILRERPAYFPLFIEFWAHAVREPRLREDFGQRLAALRLASARLVSAGAAGQGFELDSATAERLGLFIAALGNGLALERAVDPEAVPDELYGDLVTLFFNGLTALGREARAAAEREG